MRASTPADARVSELADLINGFPFDSSDFRADAEVPLVRIRDLASPDFETFVPQDVVPRDAYLRDGDVVIGMDGDFNAQLWRRGRAALNQRVCALRARAGTDPRYLAYAIPPHLAQINELTWSTTVKHLSSGAIRAIRVPRWPPEQQVAIADWLDRETAQIDAFIAKNEELIALLRERRGAARDAVLDARVGDGRRVKGLLIEVDCRAGDVWRSIPLLSVSIASGVQRRASIGDDQDEDLDLSHYKLVEPGDIVLNRMRAFQGALGTANEPGLVSPDYAVLRPSAGISSEWLANLMRSRRFVGEMTSRLKGIGDTTTGAVRTPRINVADLGGILVDVPEPGVQADEALSIRSMLARVERAHSIARRAVELARERRAALISAAVTGKIDVGVAA